jgi:hypothetical protein
VFAWVKPETKFWGGIVFLLIAALGYLAVKATRGYAIGYTKYKISGGVMATLVFVPGFGSLMLALMLPNNYFNEIDSVRELYEQNELWIAVTIITLLFTFIILFGTIFTLAARLVGAGKTYS